MVEEYPGDTPSTCNEVYTAVDVTAEVLTPTVGKLVLEGADETIAGDVDHWTIVGVQVVGVQDGCAILCREGRGNSAERIRGVLRPGVVQVHGEALRVAALYFCSQRFIFRAWAIGTCKDCVEVWILETIGSDISVVAKRVSRNLV